MKKSVSVLLAFIMVFSVMSVGIVGLIASADSDTNFLLSHPAPQNVENTLNPYGKPANRPFSLSTMNELFYYQSWDGSFEEYKLDLYESSRNPTLDLKYSSAYDKYSDGTYWLKDPNRANSSDPSGALLSFSNTDNNFLKKYRLSYVQSVGCDPLGHGKDDFIAFIGYSNYKVGDNWTYHTYVILQNLKTNQQYAIDLDSSSWTKDQDLPYYLNAAYYEIAAGDFDDDGKDSIVVYFPAAENNVRVCELSFNGSSLSSKTVTTIANLRPESADMLSGRDNRWEFKPTVSFAVGDFDADGVEDLAISTGFGNPEWDGSGSAESGLSKSGVSFERYVTGVSVMQYSGAAWSVKDTKWMYDRSSLISSDNESSTYYYKAMHMGEIAAGDIDGNGTDDIICAGYTSYDKQCKGVVWKDTSKGIDISRLGDMDKENYAYSIISYNGSSYTKTTLDKIQIGKAEKEHFYHDDDLMWPQIQVEAAYTNGRSNPAEVFIDGSIYSGKSGSLISQFDTKVYTQSFSSFMNGSTTAGLIFTTQVAAGNFDGNVAGREQFIYVLAFKEKGARDYATFMGIVGGCEFDDVVETVNGKKTVTDYGEITGYGCSDIRGNSGDNVDSESDTTASKCLYNKGDHWTDSSSKCLNTVVCAVDYDDDGLLGRFNNHSFITTDPSPVAVLQASPYFKSLYEAGAYGDEGNNAGTTYTIGYSYDKTTSKGNSVSFGVGFAGELQAGHFKASLEVGYSLDWSETFEKSVTKEYEQSFTANQDSVLVTIVPVHVYSYDIYDSATDSFKENSYSVTVPAEPVYRMMGIDEYNNAVDEYNAYIDSLTGTPKANKLKKITYGENYVDAVLPDAEGNPYVYQEWTKKNQIDDLSNGARFGTGIAGATIESSYNYTTGTSHSTEMAHGFNFSLTLQGGGKVGNEVELWGGGYVNLDYSHSTGQTVSISNSEGFKVGIVDPSPNSLVSASELPKYYFNWYLAQWAVNLTEGEDQKTPVVGFGVSDVTSPVGPPKNLEAVYNLNDENAANSSITLTWEKPDKIPFGPGVSGYYIYDEEEQINSQVFIPSDSDNISYTINSVEYGSKHHFTVKAVTAGTDYLSTPSNEAILGWVSNAVSIETIVKDTTYQSTDGLTDKYIITLSDGSTSDFYVRNGKDGEDGADGSNGKDAFDVAVENGYTGSYNDWLGVIGAKCSAEGHSYITYSVPGSCGTAGIALKVCSECGFAAAEETAALSHDYQAVKTVEPTCTTPGYTVNKCLNCGDMYFDNETAATGHSYSETVIAPSHNICGYTKYVCDKCGDTYCDNLTAMTGHSYTEKIVEPTCTQEGYTEKTCGQCGIVIRTDIVPASGHTYTDSVVAPTCTESGYTEKTCSGCGLVIRTDSVAAAGHSYLSTVTEPTCSHYGFTTYKCNACGEEKISALTAPTEHKFKDKTVESSCTAGGFTVRYCEECGYSAIVDETQAKGHDFEVTEKVEPTCISKGYSVYTCKNCGVSYSADETACKAHSYSDKVIEPDCVNGGYTIHTCKDCGFTLIDSETPATAHTPGQWICEDPATGRYTQRCENCYKLLDTKTVSINSGNVSGENGDENPVNPNIDENGVLNIGYRQSQKITLEMEGLDTGSIVFTSSDSKVATVDSDGTVTAVGPGEAVITASIPGTAIATQVPVSVKLTWWQKIHYILNAGIIFRILFMLFGVDVKK